MGKAEWFAWLAAMKLPVRLLEMGLTPGCQVQVLVAGRWAIRLNWRLRGYRLSVRRTEAARIEVEGRN